MKRFFCLACLLLLVVGSVYAQPVWWGPGDVVLNNDTPVSWVKVHAGTTIHLSGNNTHIVVNLWGRFETYGNADSSVIITSDSPNNPHNGIVINSGGLANFRYTEIQYMDTAVALYGSAANRAQADFLPTFTVTGCTYSIVAPTYGNVFFNGPVGETIPGYTHKIGQCRFYNRSLIDIGEYCHLLMLDNAEIKVTTLGSFRVYGTDTGRVTFDRAVNGWYGVTVDGGQCTVNSADFAGFTVQGIYVNNPVTFMNIDNSTLSGANLAANGIILRLWGSPTLQQVVTNTDIGPTTVNSSGIYLLNSNVYFENSTIHDCRYVNTYISAASGTFHNCLFSGRCSLYSVLTNNIPCAPDFKCCTFQDLGPRAGLFQTSVFCGSGTTPTFGLNALDPNTFFDDAAYLMVIQGAGALPTISGYNNWFQNNMATGRYIEWRNPPAVGTYNAENQYWANGVNNNMFWPNTPGRFDYIPLSALEYFCIDSMEIPVIEEGKMAGDESTTENSVLMNRFTEAASMEHAGNPAAAAELFMQVALETTNNTFMWTAASHAVAAGRCASNGSSSVPSFIQSIAARDDDAYRAALMSRELLAGYFLGQSDYVSAANQTLELLAMKLTHSDYVRVATSLLGIEMSAFNSDGVSGLSDIASQIPEDLRVSSVEEGLQRELEILASLDEGSVLEAEDIITGAPEEYALNQNYPNPFNPTTEISFELKEAGYVTLKVYNMIGQEVTTLVKDRMNKGHHSVAFDASGMASGVYIYRIEANGFSAQHKMLLMK